MARQHTSVKPETEQQLSDLQEKYLLNRTDATDYTHAPYFQDMFAILVPYTRSLVLKTTKGKIYLPPDLVESAAIEATMKLLSRYSDPTFSIGASFAGYLKFKILEVLYSTKAKRDDLTLSLNEMIDKGTKSSSSATELGDLAESLNFTYMCRPSNGDITDDPSTYAYNIVDDAIDSAVSVAEDIFSSTDFYTACRVVDALLLYARKTGYEKYKATLDGKEQELVDLSLLEIHNRLNNTVD